MSKKKTEMQLAIDEIISRYKRSVIDDVNARLRAKSLFLSDDEFNQEKRATESFIDTMNYFAEKTREAYYDKLRR